MRENLEGTNPHNALDLIPGVPVDGQTFAMAESILKQNFGVAYVPAKMNLLANMVREEGWSKERFERVFKWFLKNKPWPAWTIADWFSYSIPVYTYGWYLQQCNEGRNVEGEIERYKLPDGTVVYKPRDGQTLPFEKVELRRHPIMTTCNACGQDLALKDYDSHTETCAALNASPEYDPNKE